MEAKDDDDERERERDSERERERRASLSLSLSLPLPLLLLLSLKQSFKRPDESGDTAVSDMKRERARREKGRAREVLY